MQIFNEDDQLCLFAPGGSAEKTCLEPLVQEPSRVRTSASCSTRSSELKAIPYMFLDLTPGHGNLLGLPYWELDSPWLGGSLMLNTGPAPLSAEDVYSLSQILEDSPHRKYYLTRKACLGILRRASQRGKELPSQLKAALLAQAGLAPYYPHEVTDHQAYHINQCNEGIDLGGVSGALMRTQNMQMQTFVTQATRTNYLTPWDAQQKRIFLPDGAAPTLSSGESKPGGLLFAAGFCAGAGPSAGSVGYQEEVSPTLKASPSGNMMPSVLCLNDQGGIMDCTENMSGTLRAQEHGHQPLIFENHGIDARYTGPHPVAPTLSARAGTGGNNLPLALQSQEIICISKNAIDRQPQNGGNGLGCQEDIAYTLTATDRNAVYSRQRVDVFKDDNIASTKSARQHKDATDLVCQPMYQETVGELTCSDRKGPNSRYVGQDKLVLEGPLLIRRLTPLECERLQGLC